MKAHGDTAITLAEIAKLTALSMEEVTEDVKELESQGLVHTFAMRRDTYVWHTDSARAALSALGDALKKYEEKFPYRYGMKKAEVQMTYFKKMKPNVFDKVVELFIEQQNIKRVDEFLSTPDYEVKKDAVFEKVSKIMLDVLAKANYDFAKYSEIDFKGISRDVTDDILNILMEEDKIVKVTEDMYTLKEYMDYAKEVIQGKLKEDPLITIAQVRDIFNTSRKSAKPILEYMDSIKVTKKTGAESERVAY